MKEFEMNLLNKPKFYTIVIEGDAERAFQTMKLFVDLLKDISQVEIVYAGYPIDIKPNGWFKVYCVEKEQK